MRDGYSPEKAQALFEKLPAQLKNSSAVRALALCSEPPFASSLTSTPLTAEDPSGSSRLLPAAGEIAIGAGYFATLGESMLAGREFSDQDEQLQPCGALVFARDFESARGAQTSWRRQRHRQATPRQAPVL